ncbi:hypothetical protein P0136_10975 [Lentisphaerota bacterium ZTH]|nr:hypothetical protein JYG24_11505 [Lentisphaerota bacterium]WET05884.1 hypothetical protein P0136_10975 [Lentisphaerota bacterium ZTH]
MPYSQTVIKNKAVVIMRQALKLDNYHDRVHQDLEKCLDYFSSDEVKTLQQIRAVFNDFIELASLRCDNFFNRKKYSTSPLIFFLNKELNNDRELTTVLCLSGDIKDELIRLMNKTIETCAPRRLKNDKRNRLIKCCEDLQAEQSLDPKTAESFFRRFVWHAAQHRNHGWGFGSTRREKPTTTLNFINKYLNHRQILKEAFFPDTINVSNEQLLKFSRQNTNQLLRGDIAFISGTYEKSKCVKTITLTSWSNQFHASLICGEKGEVIEANPPKIRKGDIKGYLWYSNVTVFRNKSRIVGETIGEFGEMIYDQMEKSENNYGQYSSHSRMIRAITPFGIGGRYNEPQFNNRNLSSDFYCSNFVARCILAANQFYREFPPAERLTVLTNPINAEISPGNLKKALINDPCWERIATFNHRNFDVVNPGWKEY